MRVDDLNDVAARLRAHQQQQAQDDAWPDLDPLPELQDDAPAEFPADALGPVLGPATAAVADAVQVPASLAAGSVLAVAAVAAQRIADVAMPHGQVSPLSLFLATVAGSGDRKSTADSAVCAPIDEQRRRDVQAYSERKRDYEREKANRGRGDAEPEVPVARSLVISKATTEGLHHLLKTQPTVGLFSTEGAELVGGHSMREDRKSAGIAWMLKAWGGETLDTLTRGDGLSVLFGRRVSMHVLLQPVIAGALMADPLAQGQGWIARCLVAAPRSIAGTRLFRAGARPARERPEVIEFHERIKRLLEHKVPAHPAGDGVELHRRVIGLSPGAGALWVEFYDDFERRQAPGSDLAGVQPWASKAAEHAARIAGVIEACTNPDATHVSLATMEGAIGVTAFYMSEHIRLMGQSVDRLHAERMVALLTFMRERRPSVRHSDVLQSSPREVRNLKAEGLVPLLGELAQRGYVRRRGDRWEVRP